MRCRFGLALHGGYRPFGGTFLTFSDYARNGVRMSALMKLPVTYVFTHDSIGLGDRIAQHSMQIDECSIDLVGKGDQHGDQLETHPHCHESLHPPCLAYRPGAR